MSKTIGGKMDQLLVYPDDWDKIVSMLDFVEEKERRKLLNLLIILMLRC